MKRKKLDKRIARKMTEMGGVGHLQALHYVRQNKQLYTVDCPGMRADFYAEVLHKAMS